MNWLKEMRLQQKQTQKSVANKAGITNAFYSMIENGSRQPSAKVARRIAATLGFPNDWYRLLEKDTNQVINYRARREKMQLSAEEAADLLGITIDEYRLIETGETKPSAEILEILPLVM